MEEAAERAMSRSPLSKQVQPQPVPSSNFNPNVPSFVPMTTSGNPPPNLGINSSILGSAPQLTTMGPPTVRAMTSPAVLSSGGHPPPPPLPAVPLLVKNQPSLLGNPPFYLLVHQSNPNVLPNRLPNPVYFSNLFDGNVPPPPLSPPTSFQTSEPSPSGCGVEKKATEKVHIKRKRGCRGKESQRRRRNAKFNARRKLNAELEAKTSLVKEDEEIMRGNHSFLNENISDDEDSYNVLTTREEQTSTTNEIELLKKSPEESETQSDTLNGGALIKIPSGKPRQKRNQTTCGNQENISVDIERTVRQLEKKLEEEELKEEIRSPRIHHGDLSDVIPEVTEDLGSGFEMLF